MNEIVSIAPLEESFYFYNLQGYSIAKNLRQIFKTQKDNSEHFFVCFNDNNFSLAIFHKNLPSYVQCTCTNWQP